MQNNNNNNLAPIVLFVYNRTEHTKRTIEALKKNVLANESILYIYSDGAKNTSALSAVEEIRKYLKSIDGFKEVIVIEREKNFGLANSIINGVTSVINKHKKVIVLEDDLLTGKYFLDYMNRALDTYEEREDIFSITGFSFSQDFMKFPKEYQEEIYLNIRPMSWSWATWKDRWESVDWEIKDFDQFIQDSSKIKAFNRGGTDLTRMLKNQMNGRLNSWYIRWTYNAYKQNKFTIYPKISYINNIGHDISGTHCVEENNNIYDHTELNMHPIKNLNKDIEINYDVVNSFNRGFNTNYWRILKRKTKKMYYKIKGKS